jgi:hypothetical protein
MTATPKETKYVSNIGYFGEPTYTYSLKQGIEDGFLAPYKVIRIDIDKDIQGWRPPPGMTDDLGREVPDREYNQMDMDKILVLNQRTRLVARRVMQYLNATDPFAKTIIFCEDVDHADRMRAAIVNEAGKLAIEHPKYVMRGHSSGCNFAHWMGSWRYYYRFFGKVAQMAIQRETFIAPWTKWLLDECGKWTLLRWLEKKFGESFWLVDVYALSFFALSFVFYILSSAPYVSPFPAGYVTPSCVFCALLWIVVPILLYRVWDWAPYILRVSIFTEPRKGKTDIKDPKRTVILLILNYLELIFWFAALYSTFNLNGWLSVKEGTRPLATLRESTMLMVANWSGNFEGLSRSAWFAVTFQSLFGLLMTLMIVSRFIAFLPPADPKQRKKSAAEK